MDYFFWEAIHKDGFCYCGSLENFEDARKIKKGIPVAKYFPDDAFFQMDPDSPENTMLADGIRNRGRYVLVSMAVRDILKGYNVSHVEYLPVRILDHKSRIASKDYCIVNSLDVYDAIDVEQSELVWNTIVPDHISSCSRLVLKDNCIPTDSMVFRLKYFTQKVLIRGDLAERIHRDGITGIRFTDTRKFRGF